MNLVSFVIIAGLVTALARLPGAVPQARLPPRPAPRHAPHCVTLLLSLGVHPRVVMEIVGHSAMDMTTNVYAHVSLDVQRQALDVLNAELDRESPEE
jgi:integrase